MSIRPIISALLRNKTGVVLLTLQIAITMAVIVNAAFIVNQRLSQINRDPGFDVPNMLTFQSWGFGKNYNHEVAVREDTDFLASLPGVLGVTTTGALPLSNSGSMNTFRNSGDEFDADGADVPDFPANTYYVNEQVLDAFGVSLYAGRTFYPEEILPRARGDSKFVPVVMMTRDLAMKAFGTEDAVGKTLYDSFGRPAEVVGVIENMQGAWVTWDDLTHVLLLPGTEGGPFLRYAVRTEPGSRDAIIKAVEEQLPGRNSDRMIRQIQPYTEIVARSYRRDHSMTILLIATVILLVSITSLGIIGLASFAVRQRTKQIGTRRAVGATRGDIVRYFLLENWLVTTAGVVLGVILAVAMNMWLVESYALEKLDWMYLPVGVVVLWLLGQLAVLVPALRAANIPPATATRSV
jgi:putative ABC transport system permease protein